MMTLHRDELLWIGVCVSTVLIFTMFGYLLKADLARAVDPAIRASQAAIEVTRATAQIQERLQQVMEQEAFVLASLEQHDNWTKTDLPMICGAEGAFRAMLLRRLEALEHHR